MGEQQFHQSVRQIRRLEVLPLAALLVITMFFAPTPNSIARVQQDNRQLKRAQPNAQQRRIALVLGNGAYQNVAGLKNPPNDATLLAATLRKLGFEVTVGTDKSQREMKQLIREFGQRLRGGGGVGLFYFAGHGVQARGHNYLIPVDADIQTEADLEDVAVDVNYVLNMMDDAQNALNIAILDACRNNPFARSFRSAQEGLAQVKAPTGTLIAYATSPDSVAADGGGANSPYAEELTKQIQVSGVLLETMFRRVAEQVSSRSGGRQEPWYSANVKGDFYFGGEPATSYQANGINPRLDPAAFELSYWESIKNSSDPEDFESYLQRFPNGQFAELARRRAAAARSTLQSSKVQAENVGTGNPNNAAMKENFTLNTTHAYELYQRRDYAAARSEAKQLSQLNPNDSEAWKIAGFAEQALKLYAESAADLQKALDLQRAKKRDDPNTLDALAQAYLLSEKFDQALPLLTTSTHRAGVQPTAQMLYYRGLAEYKTGNPQEAERTFNSLVKANPKDSLSLYYLAQIALGRNDVDGTIAQLNRATIADPRFSAAWALLISTYFRRGALAQDTTKARTDYLNAVQAGESLIKLKSDLETLTLFSQALIATQQYARAADVLERAMVGTDAKGVTFYLLGVAHSRLKNFPKAIVALETAVTMSPDDVNVYRELGYAYEISKQYSKALDAYRNGLKLRPNDSDFKVAIKRVEPFAH
ncbi:MAG TPA: caspase family protein [Pyrinomonadaceae bacterium]|jgi:tetratricopeptide (TPR) repeat protein|nr:caspase family protein [Pyrinomonadaceae bacterium]